MFFRTIALTASFVLLAAATGHPPPTTSATKTTTVTVTSTPKPTIPASQCSTGPVQCCDSTSGSKSAGIAGLLGLLGVVLQGVEVLVGSDCSPISVIGVGGGSCSTQAVCCENNTFNGVIAVGCTPVNLGL